MPKITVRTTAYGLLLASAIGVSTTTVASAQNNTLAQPVSSIPDVEKLGTVANPKRYTIDSVTVSGVQFMDPGIIKSIAGLTKGQVIQFPDDQELAQSIKVLWNQGMFSDVKIFVTRVNNATNEVSLDIYVKERPRLVDYKFVGITNTQQTELKEKLGLVPNKMVTDAMKKDIVVKTTNYYADKGYMKPRVRVVEGVDETSVNGTKLLIYIDKGTKVHINNINITGTQETDPNRLKRAMKGTKEMSRLSLYPSDLNTIYSKPDRSFGNYLNDMGPFSLSKTRSALNPYFRPNIFATSKFNEKKYEDDKSAIIDALNTKGFRDAVIEKDTTYYVENGHLNVDIKVQEGKKYYFGDITWKGNTRHTDSILNKLLDIKKGDIYNKALLEARLQGGSGEGVEDVGSIYMDDGYLGFQAIPIEKSVVGDTINYEIQVNEGPQFTIKNIIITGNDRTNDYILRRELFTLPGQKFNRSMIIRSIRQISQLGYIDPEKIEPKPIPNQADKTVDIEFHVVEKSSDQLELSAGYGGGIGFTGTAGITFNNFSIQNLFKFKDWSPLGDGQRLAFRLQSNGLWYNSLNASFTEPWLGGKKPIGLTISANYTRYAISQGRDYYTNKFLSSPYDNYISNMGLSASVSRRVSWPDDNFVFSVGLEYSNYFIKDYPLLTSLPEFRNGNSDEVAIKFTLARNSVDQPLYPRSGSNINFTASFTPPFSLFSDKDYRDAPASVKYKWIEYHKYRFVAEWYQRVAGNLVLKLGAKYGFIGYYNKDIGYSPFGRYQVGGDGLSGYNYFIGREIIAQRGYDVYGQDFTIFNKYTAELRYPFSLNPQATIYGLAFFEAANGYQNMKTYNPMSLYRSVGVGLRVFLPMFGLLGLDYGIGIDKLHDITGQKQGLSQAAKFTFMLGQEPQ